MAGLIKLLAIAVAFFLIAGLLISLGTVRGCSRSASEAAIAGEIRDVPPSFKLSASQLVSSYISDEDSATVTYNQTVGIVEGPSILVEESNHLRFYVDRVWAVRCFLSDEQVNRVRDLRGSRIRVRSGGVYGAFESRGIGSGWPVSFTSLPVYALKGRVEGINNKHLTVDLRGCIVQESP